ncbi:pyrroline-5-carboxylate reductase dimerization-domain-containing protein [Neurospora tetraspora]|uniref:Pyrroline-5-carboxylate reductase n=1 Tax=Neurospora tetraspora TaxID=94610 RepID=A0AAE0MPI3_9PEZI|nr:pyrroline-5-carboxylate reductase dimerization-domain-containing protein [Neurospora tetraspora]
MAAPQVKSSSELTMAVLGCGTMGISILSGILTSLTTLAASPSPPPTNPPALPRHFIATVRSPSSIHKVESALSPLVKPSVSTLRVLPSTSNVSAVAEADIILLGCKPYMVSGLLSAPGMKDALTVNHTSGHARKQKIIISICAGVTVPQLEQILREDVGLPADDLPIVVRAMPNTASKIRESMTVINTVDPPLPDSVTELLTWIFERIGEVVYLPPNLMDACTSLCASGTAFFALMMEAAADGGVAMGLPRAEATRMAAQTMRGAAGLVLEGEHPAILREKVSTPGGCTIGGLLVLEEGGVRGAVARAVREATVVASLLGGGGAKNVNGTRH